MITVRPSRERGHFDHGWLDTYHTFSFGDYRDPAQMGFRTLRVINEDRVQAGQGFGTHPHRDMEIVTYIVDGALEHRDSLGNGEIIRRGEVQRMTAGTGVMHSEFNPSATDGVHLLQIWIRPERSGLPPSYEQKLFPDSDKRGRLLLLVSRDGRNGSLAIHQDASIFSAMLAAGEQLDHKLATGRHGWIQLVRGEIAVNGVALRAGDGAAISDEQKLLIKSNDESELLLFDLA